MEPFRSENHMSHLSFSLFWNAMLQREYFVNTISQPCILSQPHSWYKKNTFNMSHPSILRIISSYITKINALTAQCPIIHQQESNITQIMKQYTLYKTFPSKYISIEMRVEQANTFLLHVKKHKILSWRNMKLSND